MIAIDSVRRILIIRIVPTYRHVKRHQQGGYVKMRGKHQNHYRMMDQYYQMNHLVMNHLVMIHLMMNHLMMNHLMMGMETMVMETTDQMVMVILMTIRMIIMATYLSNDVYIGNRIRFHPQKYPQTKWGNPYAKCLKKYGRNKVIKMYTEYIMNKPELLKLIALELKVRTLGCWCKPEAFHGDVLAELADADADS